MQENILVTDTPLSPVLWGYFISLECYFSEATEAFYLIRLIRWSWAATWLVMQVCVWEISPSGGYSIRCSKAEQIMYLLLLWPQANHHVYLRYCPAGRITGSREADVILLASIAKKRLYSNIPESRDRLLNESVTKGVILCDKRSCDMSANINSCFTTTDFFWSFISEHRKKQSAIKMWEERLKK